VELGRGGRLPQCFFFASRRRHTRSYGDWSSDVCSSDLDRLNVALPGCAVVVRCCRDPATETVDMPGVATFPGGVGVKFALLPTRSEERRVGKECRTGWLRDHYKKNKNCRYHETRLDEFR